MDSRLEHFTVNQWRDVFAETLVERSSDGISHGRRRQATMSPRLTYGRHFGPPLPSTRPAAVMVLLTRLADEWQIPLTVRPVHLRFHGGQVSLPGGAQEPNETSRQAALRELQEELGCDTSRIEIIGRLSRLYVYNSDFLVIPWVGITETSLSFVPDKNEVADWFGLPMKQFARQSAGVEKQIRRGGLRFSAPAFDCQNHKIWGATSMILSEFQAFIRSVA